MQKTLFCGILCKKGQTKHFSKKGEHLNIYFIYLLKQNVNNGYDTTDSIVVIARNLYDAVRLKPLNRNKYGDWVDRIDDIEVELIGTSNESKPRIVIESFNAG